MNPWADFLITVTIRFVAGIIIGCILAYVFGFRVIMNSIANGDFPIERFLAWGIIGGILCACTTPREHWPWTEN